MTKKITRSQLLKDIKTPIARTELRRAHYIITILAFTLAALVVMSIVQPLQFDSLLGGIAASLLLLVGAISLSISIAISRLK